MMSPLPSRSAGASARSGSARPFNELVRAGLTKQEAAAPFRQKTHDLGQGIDLSNVADAIETLDGPAAR